MFTKVLSSFSLALFLFLFYALAYESEGTLTVWTLIIPILPLFIVLVGYNNWRNICPLSFFAKLTQNINIFKKKKVPLWFEENVFIMQFFILLSAFTMRIYFLNSSSLLLSLFLIFVVVLAFASGLIFTGKTWCNFFCPVSLVERIYSTSSSQQESGISACSTCSACKINCPDIDMESSYWKEVVNTKKKLAFYAFPGLVLGFYFYYYFQAGSWAYYFSGAWTLSSINISEHLFSPGFYFYKDLPLILAAPLTLTLFSILSYLLFFSLEYLLKKMFITKDKKTISHITNTVSAFCAFNIFYIFAGAPTYSEFPILYSFFQFIIILTSSTVLYKEIFREEKYFLQEKFARKIIEKWTEKKPPSKNLKEIYYTYIHHQKDHEVHLEVYKETIEELFYTGILSLDNEHIIHKFQKQFKITPNEHEKIINTFKRSCTDISSNPLSLSSEKLYQLQHYKSALKNIVTLNLTNPEQSMQKLKLKFNIQDNEHSYIFNKIINQDSLVHDQINELLEELLSYTKVCKPFYLQKSVSLRYLYFLLDENRLNLMQELKSYLKLCFSASLSKQIFQDLHAKNLALKPYFLEIFEPEHKDIKENFSLLFDETIQVDENIPILNLKEVLSKLLHSKNDRIVACTLYVISEKFTTTLETFNIHLFANYDSSLVKEIALKILYKSQTVTQIEKEAFLRKVALFTQIDSNNLSKLAEQMQAAKFQEGEVIVKENEEGDSLFVLTHGKASIFVHKEGSDKEIACIHEGDYIGEISIFSNLPRTATVKASTPLSTLELSGSSFKEFILEQPLVTLPLMQEITKRLIALKA